MKKHLLIFALILSLLAPCALAEEAYVPGSVAESLFGEALDAGQIVSADLKLSLALDPAALGIPESEQEAFSAILQALSDARLTIGSGKLENGIRIELGAAYAPQGAADQAQITAAANITRDGLLLESSLIEGESVYASWETLLALSGMSQSEIMAVMSLSNMDLDAALAMIQSLTVPYVQQIGRLLTPYGETLLAFVDSLNLSLDEDPEALEGYPETDKEVIITVTAKELGTLLTTLADQLEQDTALAALLDSLLASLEPGSAPFTSTAEFCAQMRTAASGLTDTSRPLTLYVGYDAQDRPIYLSMTKLAEDGSEFIASLIVYPTENDLSVSLLMDAGVVNAEQTLDGGLTVALDIVRDESDALVFDSFAGFNLYGDSGALLSFSFDMDQAAVVTEDNLPGYQMTQNLDLSMEGEISQSSSSQYLFAMTPEGGEYFSGEGSVTMEQYGQTISSSFLQDVVFFPGEAGPTAQAHYVCSMPELGVDSVGVTANLRTAPYDPADTAALAQTTVDAASTDHLTPLLLRANSALEAELSTLFELLPPELLQMIIGSDPADSAAL